MPVEYVDCTSITVKELQSILKKSETLECCNGFIIILDEIQTLNKSQIKTLLGESANAIIIGCTTSNPYFLDSAVISRCSVFEFKPIESKDIVTALKRCVMIETQKGKNVKYSDNALYMIADISNGDLRKAINIMQLIISSSIDNIDINEDIVIELNQGTRFMNESEIYDYLSMFHKSIRNSDVDASLLSLGVLLKAGRLEEVIRRILVVGAEDCFATLCTTSMYSNLYALTSAAKSVGMPEARIILSSAVIMLATAPKSHSSYMAIKRVFEDLDTKDIGSIQPYLRDGHYKSAKKLGVVGYKYPHDYPNNYVKQECMTTNTVGVKYYIPGENKYEQGIAEYWKKIKGE